MKNEEWYPGSSYLYRYTSSTSTSTCSLYIHVHMSCGTYMKLHNSQHVHSSTPVPVDQLNTRVVTDSTYSNFFSIHVALTL